jgi:aminoglycoside phosphotransferase (APT) family kinase protein
VSEVDADGTVAVREEDAPDLESVTGWLTAQLGDLGGSPSVRQYPGGASNLTYLLRYPARAVVLRTPPRGHKAASAHDMRREFVVQSALRPAFPTVPKVLAMSPAGDAYAMEPVRGLILRSDLPPDVHLDREQAGALSTAVVDRLVALHSVDPSAVGLADLGRGPGYVRRQVEGWSRRFRAARTEDVPDFESVMTWLGAHQPDDAGACVIHNDRRFDNLVLDTANPLTILAVLDWEMATVGDPLMELGSALAYWVQADDDEVYRAMRRQPTHVPGMLSRDEVVSLYAQRTGRDVGDWRFYEAFGLFRLAVILQQIWWRYVHNETTNPAFAMFGSAVGYLNERARSRITT